MITDKKEQQVLLNLRGKVLRSKDGTTITVILSTDTKTGIIVLGDGEKSGLVSLCIVYVVPDDVFDV